MRRSFGAVLVLAVGLGVPPKGAAQLSGVENGEWRYLGGDAGHTRSNPGLTQIDASNFSELEVAWIWWGSNFGAGVEYTTRSTPVFADGVLYTVSGQRIRGGRPAADAREACPDFTPRECEHSGAIERSGADTHRTRGVWLQRGARWERSRGDGVGRGRHGLAPCEFHGR